MNQLYTESGTDLLETNDHIAAEISSPPSPPSRPSSDLISDPAAPSTGLSRRALLGVGAAAGALLLPRENAQADTAPGGSAPAQWTSPELRLARRVTMGLSAWNVNAAQRMRFRDYLECELNSAIDDSAVENYIAQNFTTLALSPADMNTANTTTSGLPQSELIQATLYRALYSRHQLHQRMVEFWTDHFNIDINKVSWLKVIDDRDVIRPNALGKFSDLLKASAHSPAMLDYLDNSGSRKEHPNQNYAREMMELHTLGVNGGYTQTDVSEVARCFTGWTRNYDKTSADYGKFVFNAGIHDTGEKKVLGVTIPAKGGIKDGDMVLDIVANHPSTATFVSTKMLHWLLREDPSPTLIAQVAKVFTDTRGDIKAVIRAILTSDLLMAAPARYKRPYHLVTSTARAGFATVTGLGGLISSVKTLGQTPFAWSPPNGYPDALAYWAGLILPRWNFGLAVPSNRIGDVKVDVSGLLALSSPADMVSRINATIFYGEMSSALQAELLAYLGQKPVEARVRDAVGLALASAEFQLY